MSKKTNKKKKINLKLEPGQTFMIEDLQTMLHIQKTYAAMIKSESSSEDRLLYNKVITAADIAIKNVHIASGEDMDNENYWS